MSERSISYLNRTYEDYRKALIEFTRQFYPEIANDLSDASIGSWLIDLVSVIGDNLSYYIDKAYNETNIDSATKASSIYALSRSNGLKIPGPKGSIVELEFSCSLPISVANNGNDSSSLGMPNYTFAPVIKKGTRVRSSSGIYFETNEDIDFSEQFDNNGVSNRNYYPLVNSNNQIKLYRVTKTCTATAGMSKIYKMAISSAHVKPYMEVVIPELNVMNVESIIFIDGANFQSDPSTDVFMTNKEHIKAKSSDNNSDVDVYKFFEVDSLTDQYVWGDRFDESGNTVAYKFDVFEGSNSGTTPNYSVTKGEWKPIKQKYITEFTDNGYLKVIFGSGEQIGQSVNIDEATDFTKYQVSRMVRNNFLGVLPKVGTMMYILYRVGGGAASNVAKGTVNSIVSMNAVNKRKPNAGEAQAASAILSSIEVTNTIPSVSGKDAPTEDEIKAMIKYHNAAQQRCVTLKDYEDRVMFMPPRYGCPFRVKAIEVNNKVMLYLLLINNLGQLSDAIPSTMVENIQNYIAQYRTINDYVEIKSGGIINISVEVDAYIQKSYDSNDVVDKIISTVKNYMDINKHQLGEDIYVSDIEKEISKIDGVINLIDLRIYHEQGDGYSNSEISQETMYMTDDDGDSKQINLEASDYILNSSSNEMFEIKYPDKDIRVRFKTR